VAEAFTGCAGCLSCHAASCSYINSTEGNRKHWLEPHWRTQRGDAAHILHVGRYKQENTHIRVRIVYKYSIYVFMIDKPELAAHCVPATKILSIRHFLLQPVAWLHHFFHAQPNSWLKETIFFINCYLSYLNFYISYKPWFYAFFFYRFLVLIVVIYFMILQLQQLHEFMALNSLLCSDVPLRNCSLTHSCWLFISV